MPSRMQLGLPVIAAATAAAAPTGCNSSQCGLMTCAGWCALKLPAGGASRAMVAMGHASAGKPRALSIGMQGHGDIAWRLICSCEGTQRTVPDTSTVLQLQTLKGLDTCKAVDV